MSRLFLDSPLLEKLRPLFAHKSIRKTRSAHTPLGELIEFLADEALKKLDFTSDSAAECKSRVKTELSKNPRHIPEVMKREI